MIKIRKEITKNVLDKWNLLRKLQNKKKVKNMYFTDFLTTLIKKKIKLKAVFIKRGWLEFDQPSDLDIKF